MQYEVAPLLDSPPMVRYGLPEYVTRPSPAAATVFAETLDGRFYARLICISARLVTDGNAANRTLFVAFLDGAGNRFAMSAGIQTQAASLTRDWYFNVFAPSAIADIDNSMVTPLAPILMQPTFAWNVGIANVQAGDQLSRIRFVWERFYTDGTPNIAADQALAGIAG